MTAYFMLMYDHKSATGRKVKIVIFTFREFIRIDNENANSISEYTMYIHLLNDSINT